MITIYSDGACKGNGKSNNNGGYGAYIQYANGDYRKIWGGEEATTNNRMELTATIKALALCQNSHEAITLLTDSIYVKNGISQWLANWKKNHWKKSDGKPVLNVDLWQQLDALNQKLNIHWQWVKGHNGDIGNEIADKLANQGILNQGNQLFNANHELLQDDGHPDHTPHNSHHLNDIQHNNTAVNQPDHHLIIKRTSNNTPQQIHYSTFEQNPDYDGNTSQINPHFWPILPDPINQSSPERQLIMDTETTGFHEKDGDRIIEIGIIEMIGRKLTGQRLHAYFNPHMMMDAEVIQVHGISNEFVSDKPDFQDVAQRIFDFMQGAEIIAHNASFDMRFLDMEFTKAGLPKLSECVTVTDSLALARKIYPGQAASLNALVKRLGVGQKDRTFHGALLDSEILAEVYLAMTGGQVSLDMGENTLTQQAHVLNHDNLSSMADMLIASKNDMTADDAWRSKHLTS